MNPELTIVICTYNRAYLLQETLPTIFQQNVSIDRYQVLIVNNNSTDNTTEILDNYLNQYDNLLVVSEITQGLGFAKNAGMTAATTDWIVYLDDDAKVPYDFVKKALDNIYKDKFQCFGGVYLPWYKYGKPKWFHDKYASNKGKLVEFNTLEKDFISGGIMAIKKSILKKFGGFPTNLGMSGEKIAYGEETQLQIRMRNSDIEIGYDPNWVIFHLVNRYKLSPWWFIKSSYAKGRDALLIFDEDVTFKSVVIYFFRSIKLFFVNIIKYTPKLISENYRWQNWLIDILRPSVLKFGQIKGWIRSL